MSPSADSAASQWLEQLAAMRAAIADLKLPETNGESGKHELGFDLDDDDLSPASPTDDIWDLISEDEEDFSDGSLEPPAVDEVAAVGSQEWLGQKCAEVASKGTGLDREALQEQIVAILASDSSDEELQMTLADTLGFEELDLVSDLIATRKQLLSQPVKPPSGLLSKAERDARLRQADIDHKTASLAAAQNRGGEQYPHVYKAHDAGNTLSSHGKKYALPMGSERIERPLYEEYAIPATKVNTLAKQQKLVQIADLDGLCKRTFRGYTTLNRMQSLVYSVAYQTSENMLICAPTGAGKTDAAMLTILNTVAKNIHPSPIDEPEVEEFAVHTDDFKIVYVAPMKALAAEITEKLGKRLAWLGIQVRELTGDMQLTKAEISATQIIVTTPEKWDVVTRKSTGDTELVQKVRLLIIDEVHMLHDERGAVLESLVARTERQVESTQSLIRIIGLSATLPNYTDVADFLKVNRMAGLFYFDQSFRPVPLEQHFLGVKGKAGSKTSRENTDKTSELAMWWAFREKPGSKVVYIAPMKALVRERVQDWGKRLTNQMGLKLVELTGDNTPDTRTIRDADIIVTTPEKWDGISRSWQTRSYVQQVSLVIIDEIHLLGGERGPILEIIVSRMNYIASQKKGSVRIVGMSTACANAMDLANWLGVKEGLFNFRHSVRPVPLEIFIDGFPQQRGFCPLMQSMNRPTFLSIKTHSPDKPVIVFVASRRQTRLTARDLINFCGMEDNPKRFVRMSEEDLTLNLARVKDEALREAMSFGIGLHHAGLVESDRQLAEELFANNKIQILVATSTLAWGVNLPAHLVVVKGTQFFDAKIEGYKDMDLTDVLQMLGRAGRPQFDTSGIARIFTQDSKKAFYKHFLHTGFPVESSLHNVLDNHLGAEVSAETIVTKQDALDYLTWTFFFRRLHKNPSYYGLEIPAEENNSTAAQQAANDYMIEMVDHSLSELAESGCLVIHSNGDVDPTPLGKIMSYYYLAHKTIRMLRAHAKPTATFSDVLSWMSRATEYDELPVRHNEDLINAELSNNLPIKAEAFGLPMWDPHVKAFLLLQAHFSRIDLPISDYVGDQNSVLDQAIRIVQASIDVLTEMDFLQSCHMMITLLQCVKSARWHDDGPLAIFPGVEVEAEKKRLADDSSKPRSLVEATTASKDELTKALKQVGLPAPAHGKVIKALNQLPQLRVGVTDVNALGLTVSLARLNPVTNREYHIYAPRYPKPQTEGYFVVVSDAAKGDVVGLKRVSWPSPDKVKGGNISKPSTKATIKLPQSDVERKMKIIVISDSYIGMEWHLKEVEVPAPPKVVVDDSKKAGK